MLFENKVFIFAGIFIVCLLMYFILRHKNAIVKKETNYYMNNCKIIYADSSQNIKDENIEKGRYLYNSQLDLRGKPDFVFRHNFTGNIIPVEIKSGSIKNDNMPHYGDLMQLVCYFYMVEEEFGKRPKYGKLIYEDYMFEVRNTEKLRKELFLVTKRMRNMLKNNKEKPCSEYIKCRHCICAGTVCEYYKYGE